MLKFQFFFTKYYIMKLKYIYFIIIVTIVLGCLIKFIKKNSENYNKIPQSEVEIQSESQKIIWVY
jgi:hypothetical protein